MSNMENRGGRTSEENYELIEEAVMESPRGRWFLAEYAARVRARETKLLADQFKSLEATVIGNHDAIMGRIAQALGQSSAIPSQTAQAPELAPRHMKFFKRDEEIFEAAPQAEIAVVKPAPPPEEKRGAKLTIRRITETEMVAADAPPPAPVEDTVSSEPPLSPAAESAPAPLSAAAPEATSAAGEQPKRRIVIIRHKPGETVDVPMQQELAETG